MAARRGRGRSTRVTLAYDDAGFRLVQVSARPKGVGPAAQLLVEPPSAYDVWAEGRDSSGRIRYRVRLPRAFTAGTEVFDPDGSITHAPGVRPHGVLTFVVPEDSSVTSVSVHAGAEASAPASDAAPHPDGQRELFAFSLDDAGSSSDGPGAQQ